MGEPARGRTGELLEHELGKRGQTPGENARKTQKCQRQEDLRRSQPLRLTPRLLQRVPSLESSAKKPSSPRWQASRKSCETKPSTSLANAVSSGDLEAVRLLLWDGRSSDLLNEAEPGTLFTPLHTASRAGDLGVVQLLLEAGAYVNVHDSEGLTPLHHATNHEHEEVVAALLGANANPNLGTAALYTPVHFACRLGNIQLLRALLLHRGRKDLKTKDAKSTPLHLAVLSRNPDVLACLLGVGDTAFDIDATDRNGYTALQRSCQAGSERMVRDLVLAGASRHYRGKWDWTALHWAANSGHADVVATLLELGANQGIEDNDGNIAYDVATTEEVRGLLDPDVSRITARMSITNSRDPSEVTCSGLEDDDASRRWSCPASPARWSLPVSPSGHSFFSPRKSKLLSLLSPPNRASISSPRSPCQSFAASPRIRSLAQRHMPITPFSEARRRRLAEQQPQSREHDSEKTLEVSNRNSVDQKIKKPRARGQGKIPGAVSTAAACRRGPHCLSSSDEEDGGKASQENWNLHAHTLSRVYKMSSTDEEHGQEVPRHTGYPQVLDFTMTSSSDDEAKEARLSSQCSKPNAKSACEKGVKSDSRGFVGVSSDDDDDEVEDMCNEPLVLPPWISLLSPMHVPVRCQPADRMWPAASARTNPEYGCSSPNEMDSPPGSKSKRRWEQHSPQNSAVDKEGRHPQSHALFVYGGAGGSATLGTSPGGDIPIAWPGNIWHAGLVSWLKGTGFILDTVEVSGSMQLAECVATLLEAISPGDAVVFIYCGPTIAYGNGRYMAPGITWSRRSGATQHTRQQGLRLEELASRMSLACAPDASVIVADSRTSFEDKASLIAAVGRDAARKIGYPNAAALCGDLMSKFGKATKAGSYMSPATHQDVAATSRFASDLLPEALSPSPRLFMTQESMGSIVENDKQEGKQDEAHNTSSALEIASLCGALDDVLVGMAAGTCSSQIAIDMHDFIRKD